MSTILQQLGRLAEAERIAREALEIRTRVYGPTRSLVGLSQLRLAEVLVAERRLAEAESVGLSGLKIISTNQPASPDDSKRAHDVLARVYDALGRRAEAERQRSLAKAS
jgi:predicted Zn-dependent protease